jgi:hypothetical protein
MCQCSLSLSIPALGSQGFAVAGTPVAGSHIEFVGGVPTWVLGPPTLADHDNTIAHAGLWQLHGSLADTSGNGNHLAINSLSNFTDLYPNYVGFDSIGGNGLHTVTSPSPAGLRITGDMTIEAIVRMPQISRASAGPTFIVACDNNNGASTGNRLYGVGIGVSGEPYWSQMHGTQVETTYSATGFLWPEGLFQMTATRLAGVIQLYANGRPLGPPSSALTTPTGGSLCDFQFGSFGGSPLVVGIASLGVIASALSAAQVKARYNATLGPVFGLVA